MNIYSWPWFIVAVGLAVLLLVVFFGWLYLALQEEAWNFIVMAFQIISAVAAFVGAVLLISYGFSYAFTGHA